MAHNINTAAQSQKAATAYFTSNQLLPFGFAGENRSRWIVEAATYIILHGLSWRVMGALILKTSKAAPHIIIRCGITFYCPVYRLLKIQGLTAV